MPADCSPRQGGLTHRAGGGDDDHFERPLDLAVEEALLPPDAVKTRTAN
jgi:hypothetical protein